MKAHAPPPPQAPQPAPRHIFRNQVPNGGETSGMDTKENMLKPTVNLQLTLPQGYQTSVTEDGSKALMDLLVELCSHYHLNPGLHTLELLSPEGHSLGFKPNTLLGSLNVASVLIKEKVWEDKVIRRQAPKVPEKTVRLMVNYHSNQKAVVRVNPLVPLQALIPVICEKCEFDPAHILLLKDSISRHELPLHKSLTELGIKELYIHDQNSICSSTTSLGRPEKKGLLGILQFSRKKSKGLSTVSGVHGVEVRPRTLGQSQSVMNIPRMSPKAEAKKRRAPAPPGALICNMDITSFEGYQLGLGSENQQRKRKAPAPPPTPASITPGSDNTSTSAAPSPDSHSTETPTPAFSLQDSNSELSHSLDNSDTDFEQAGSHCSTLTSSTVSEFVEVQPTRKSSSSRRVEDKASSMAALNLKVDEVENNRHSTMASGQKPETETLEEETLSMGSSSGGSSLPDQGYAASEGMVEGEDSGMVSSTSDTQPTSPDGSLSLDGSSRSGGERLLGPVRDNSSDSDEGCATWVLRHSSQARRLKDSFEDDPELTAQLHDTLAVFEADLAGESSSEVPVSVVDMDVPVTAIDEVLEDYEHNAVENKEKSLIRTESTDKEPRNKNNNACTAANESNRSNTKQPFQLELHMKSPENIDDKKEEKIIETKMKEMFHIDTNSMKEDKERSALTKKSNVDMQKQSKSTDQRPVSTERGEETHRVYQNNTRCNISHGKIMCNVTSRFGMKTFTVVPHKPSVMHAAIGEPTVTLTAGAIKIDDQGNMVTLGVSQNKADGSSESWDNCGQGSSLLGKANTFWSSNKKQGKTTLKINNIEYLKTPQSILCTPSERTHKVSVSKKMQPPSNKPPLPSPLLPDVKRDLSFLKPSRQTSSQYVASAISKYTPKTSAKPNPIPNIPNCSVKTQTTAFQRSSRSMPMNPRWSDNKENGSADSKPNPTSPNKSMNYPEFISHRASKKKHIQCSDPIQINVTANNDRDNIKHFGPGSPTLSQSRPLHSSAKQPGDMTKVATHPTPDVKALPSVTVSDSTETSEYPQVTVFGPIKKFKPVICGSVEKETSLHSSLMEAIQTGGGRDRLKKISTSSPTSIRKASYVEEENERSALLSAIRAPRNSDRLRKTTSDAAVELEKFRKVTSEEERSADPSPPPSPPTLSFTSPPVFSPPPPPRPQGPMVVPPPPLPVLPQGKSSTVAHPNANTPVNPALAREAMLEAIRSGSAAVRLKKVQIHKKCSISHTSGMLLQKSKQFLFALH
uniref:Cordon-bleu WH2 repeat protein n=1 Tax=Mastacembelus armatus TaxID=205130 RepID=A0A3Q3NGJ8_9TELE